MLHTKFQGQQPYHSRKEDTLYGLTSHLGHVTQTILINVCSLAQERYWIKLLMDNNLSDLDIWAWQPPLSCGPNPVNKLIPPIQVDSTGNLASTGSAVSKEMFETVDERPNLCVLEQWSEKTLTLIVYTYRRGRNSGNQCSYWRCIQQNGSSK